MAGIVAAPNGFGPVQVQAMVRQIRQASIENVIKVLQVKKPHLSRPLPGATNRAYVNLRV
ncbi:MAG TPA: hypothetical protein VM123_03500 [archaeon]|nr:hypothetical protein [archaeon]